MTSTRESLRVVALAGRDIAEELDGATTDSGRQLTITTRTPSDLDSADADCLLVDQHELDGWCSTLERVTEACPSVPVIVLVGTDSEDAVATALKRGAMSTLPRSVCATAPSVVVTQVGCLVERDGDCRAQESGRGLEDRLRLVAESVDEIVYIANWDFSEVEYVNSAYESIWRRPVDPLYDDGQRHQCRFTIKPYSSQRRVRKSPQYLNIAGDDTLDALHDR